MAIIMSKALALAALAAVLPLALASSHREAPFIGKQPKADATDFYLFRSYEPGREQFVTLIANDQPLQEPYGGPNDFMLDPAVLYEIHIDNDGDAQEDLSFQFRFTNSGKNGRFTAAGSRPRSRSSSTAVRSTRSIPMG